MASIRKRLGKDGQVRYQCQIRRDGFPTVSKTLLSLKEAKAWITAVEHAQNVGTVSRGEKPKDITLHDALERYLTEVSPDKKGGIKERARIRVMLGYTFLTELPLRKVTPGDIARYIRERQKEVKPITVHREVAILSHLFTVARREWQLVGSNPVADTRRPKVGKGRDRRLHPDEEARLRVALRKSGNRWILPAFDFALETAVRRGELVSLRWSDVDLTRRTARLRDTKNGEDRTIPLSPRALTVLLNLPRAEGEGRVFAIADNALRLAWERARHRARLAYEAECKAAGVAPEPTFLTSFRWHDLRHEAASRLAETGRFSLIELASVTGHKDIRMLRRYVHHEAAALAAKLASLTEPPAPTE